MDGYFMLLSTYFVFNLEFRWGHEEDANWTSLDFLSAGKNLHAEGPPLKLKEASTFRIIGEGRLVGKKEDTENK